MTIFSAWPADTVLAACPLMTIFTADVTACVLSAGGSNPAAGVSGKR